MEYGTSPAAAVVSRGDRKDLAVAAGASHLFEEAGALEEVARLATRRFAAHFMRAPGYMPDGVQPAPVGRGGGKA